MYKVNQVFFEFENNQTLENVVLRCMDNKEIHQRESSEVYIILNRKIIDKKELKSVLINENDEILIMPIIGGG